MKSTVDTLRKCSRTKEGIKRRDLIVKKLFDQRKTTRVILSFYHRVFSIVKFLFYFCKKRATNSQRACWPVKIWLKLFSMSFTSRENSQVGQKPYKVRCIIQSMPLKDIHFLLSAKARKTLKDMKKKEKQA